MARGRKSEEKSERKIERELGVGKRALRRRERQRCIREFEDHDVTKRWQLSYFMIVQ